MVTVIRTYGLWRLSLLILLFRPVVGLGLADETAATLITQFHSDLIGVMKSASDLTFHQRIDRLTPAVSRTYLLELMALKVLGPDGKKLSEDDRARWTVTFTRFIVANYARRLTGYSGQVFETLAEEPAPRGTMLVRTRLVRPDRDDVRIDYRMWSTPDGWKIVDVYSNGTVSELALRRAEFGPLLAKEGLDALIAAVDRQAATQ